MLLNLLMVFSCFGNVSLMTGVAHSRHKRFTASRRCSVTRKNIAKPHVMAINGASRIVVLLDHGAFQRQAREHAFRA